jgi:hypothetical protein
MKKCIALAGTMTINAKPQPKRTTGTLQIASGKLATTTWLSAPTATRTPGITTEDRKPPATIKT